MVDAERIMRLHNSGMSVPEIAKRTLDSEGTVHDAIVREWRRDKERANAARAQMRADELNAWMED